MVMDLRHQRSGARGATISSLTNDRRVSRMPGWGSRTPPGLGNARAGGNIVDIMMHKRHRQRPSVYADSPMSSYEGRKGGN